MTIMFLLSTTRVDLASENRREGYKVPVEHTPPLNISSEETPGSLDKLTDDNWDFIQFASKKKGQNCSRVSPGHATAGYPAKLLKTVSNGAQRVVFVVGIEGTGHHMLRSIFKGSDRSICIPLLPDAPLTKNINKGGLFGSNVNQTEVKKYVLAFQEHADLYASPTTSDKVMFVNVLCKTDRGMMSYPNFKGACRELKYPDARILAEMYESIGVDFRVLVIIRNAVDILLSTSVNRHFGSWKENQELYTWMMKDVVMRTQLQRLDRKFIECIDYDALPDIPDRASEFLGIDSNTFNLQEALKQQFHVTNSDERAQLREKYMKLDTAGGYKKLQAEIDKLKQLCSN